MKSLVRTGLGMAPRRASAAIEFALWLPVLLLFVSAIVDWGWYMTQRVAVARASMDGARIGAATFEDISVTAGSIIIPRANGRAVAVLSGLGMACGAGCVVTTTYCQDGAGGVCGNPPFDGLHMSVTFGYTPFFGFVATPGNITETFMMAVESQREPD